LLFLLSLLDLNQGPSD